MSTHTEQRRLTQNDLAKLQASEAKIAMLTCYDASFAKLLDMAGTDILLVGDSLGNIVQGHDTTLPVTLEHMVYHTAAVRRGSQRAFIVADLPFGSYQASPEQAFATSAKLLRAGAQMVKIEGGSELASTIEFLTRRGIPVCAHIGLTPQSVHVLGGYRIQGKNLESAQKLINDAKSVEAAGATMLVIEAIPATLTTQITQNLNIISIGIGAGPDCDGQVLVLQDILDIPPGPKAKFVKNFMTGANSIFQGVENAVNAIKTGSFPDQEHCY